MPIGVCRESVMSLLEKHTLRSASKIHACSFSLSSTASLFSPLYISPPCFHFLFLLPGVAKPGLLYCLTLESTISIVFLSYPLGSGGGMAVTQMNTVSEVVFKSTFYYTSFLS